MLRLGVIGGMGAEATSYYYEQVIQHTDAQNDQDHVEMIIWSCSSMPDRTRAIKTGEHDELLNKMHECATALENLGCRNIAIPCNTSHYFYDQIQSFVSVPIIHMPRETVRYAMEGVLHPVPDGGVHRIGIMGTDGTVGADVYGRECRAHGIEAVYPSAGLQKKVMSLIYDDIKAGKEPDLEKYHDVVRYFLMQGCDCVVLACTELSVLCRYTDMPDYILDAMDVLVRESIIRSGARYR